MEGELFDLVAGNVGNCGTPRGGQRLDVEGLLSQEEGKERVRISVVCGSVGCL